MSDYDCHTVKVFSFLLIVLVLPCLFFNWYFIELPVQKEKMYIEQIENNAKFINTLKDIASSLHVEHSGYVAEPQIKIGER